jgi:energy-coupling factor transporter ATP-binding protein EcfA2
MPTPTHFPTELLQASNSEKLAYFQRYTVVHRRLKEAYDAFVSAVLNPGGASLIFLFGPTGVGKTTLLNQVVKVLIEQKKYEMEIDSGYLPVASVEARAPESGSFDWKDYYKSVLVALCDPFADYKLKPGSSRIYGSGSQQNLMKPRVNLATLREDVESQIKLKNLIVFLIDEAQRFTKMASGRRQQDQMDAIQSMASFTTTRHGLFGTYELLQFRNLSGQLSRRSIDIHFPRYQTDSAQDVKDFKRVLKSFALSMPLLEEPDLEQHWEYFYERSIGCVGIVKDWLTQALCSSLDSQSHTVTLTHLRPYAPSASKCLKMATEAIEGEKALAEDPQEISKLRQKLGIQSSSHHDINVKTRTVDQTLTSPTTKQKTSQRRPGERNPHRDVIGGMDNVS